MPRLLFLQKVNVSVYYETLCSDSVHLIQKQIYPTWKLLKNDLNISFVPFGKAVVSKEVFVLATRLSEALKTIHVNLVYAN